MENPLNALGSLVTREEYEDEQGIYGFEDEDEDDGDYEETDEAFPNVRAPKESYARFRSRPTRRYGGRPRKKSSKLRNVGLGMAIALIAIGAVLGYVARGAIAKKRAANLRAGKGSLF